MLGRQHRFANLAHFVASRFRLRRAFYTKPRPFGRPRTQFLVARGDQSFEWAVYATREKVYTGAVGATGKLVWAMAVACVVFGCPESQRAARREFQAPGTTVIPRPSPGRPGGGSEQATRPAERLVSLDVVAVNSRGRPVLDLKSSDFQVFDNGKRQPIAYFRTSDRRRFQSAPQPGPGEYSNLARVPVHPTLVVFELVSDLYAQQDRFTLRLNQTEELVRAVEQLEAPRSLCLYLMTRDGTVFPVHEFGFEPEAEDDGPGWVQEVRPALEGSMRQSVAVERGRPRSESELLAQLAEMPGRKNFVWISERYPAAMQLSLPDEPLPEPRPAGTAPIVAPPVQRPLLAASFERAHTAVYIVQRPYVVSGVLEDCVGQGCPNPFLQYFPGYTGGRFYPDGNVQKAIEQAVEDAAVSYRIGYYPPPRNWDGKDHKILVTCARRGIRIQTKDSYYAERREPRPEEEDLFPYSANTSPLDVSDIGLSVKVSPGAETPQAVHLDIRVEASDLLLRRQGERYTGKLLLSFIGDVAEARKLLPGDALPVVLDLSAKQREEAMKGGLRIPADLPVSAEVRNIRVVVYDTGSREMGSLTIPIGREERRPAR